MGRILFARCVPVAEIPEPRNDLVAVRVRGRSGELNRLLVGKVGLRTDG